MPDSQETQDSAPKPLRTYQSDVEAILKEGDGSFAKIAIAESERQARGGFAPEEVATPNHNRLIVGISVTLIVISIGVLSGLYFFRDASKNPVEISGPKPLIVTDAQKNLNIAFLTRDQIINTLIRERDSNSATLSSIVGIQLNEGAGETAKAVTTKQFLEALNIEAPEELARTLNDNFMLGIYALNRNQPFLILKTSYYQNAFAGMLEWEKTLRADIGSIFIVPEPAAFASTSDQITSRSNLFEDVVVKNRDSRAIRGESGKIIFLYSFADKETIIFTTNADALEKVAAQLLAGKLVQ
ncbi:MAG: hypothetical protein AAB511_01015 [Patescibacteria group bacterium]